MKEIISGAEVHYQVTGSGKDAVLLLHGWGCTMEMMQPVADALKNEHRILTVDLPGHGKSANPPEPWGVPEYAGCVGELIQRTGFYPCSVIAHSFGCRIAAWLEAQNGGYFKKIVFTGAAGIRPQQTDEARKKSRRYQRLKKCCRAAAGIPLIGKAASALEEKIRKHYGSADYNALDQEMRKTFVKVINLDLSSTYARFHAPTLLIWGDADTETPLWMAKQMESSIPDAGLVILENGTHFAYLEQLRRFNTIVSQFLKEET